VEAGGPTPGLGCAGRGIIAALDKLKEKGAYETFRPDVVIYDVLGDVVCGGFSMPMRKGYADKIFVVDKGKIVQTGTHDQLMQKEGIYKNFISARKQAVSWKLA
jgi:nitrogenase subunit NifH